MGTAFGGRGNRTGEFPEAGLCLANRRKEPGVAGARENKEAR